MLLRLAGKNHRNGKGLGGVRKPTLRVLVPAQAVDKARVDRSTPVKKPTAADAVSKPDLFSLNVRIPGVVSDLRRKKHLSLLRDPATKDFTDLPHLKLFSS